VKALKTGKKTTNDQTEKPFNREKQRKKIDGRKEVAWPRVVDSTQVMMGLGRSYPGTGE